MALGFAAVLTLAAMAPRDATAQDVSADGAYRLFFDWGKPDINGDAATILGQVVERFQRDPSARLQLTGHTDRSGNAAYNRGAGLKRAGEVRQWLAEHGVPTRAMTIASEGEDRPLVPTEDGVREVQNRRVEIRFVD